MELARAPASMTSGSMPRRFAEMAHARPMGPAPAMMAASCGILVNLSPLPARLRNNIVAYMARRVRANKSLIKHRYHAAKVAFPDDADLARSLGVHRSAVVRWKRGESPAPENWEQLVGLDTVVSLLEGFLEVVSIPKWLRGLNAHLGDRRPIDVIRQGRLFEVVAAIEAAQ